MENKPETEREFFYRLIIGQYSLDTKIETLDRMLDKLAASQSDLAALKVEFAEANRKYKELDEKATRFFCERNDAWTKSASLEDKLRYEKQQSGDMGSRLQYLQDDQMNIGNKATAEAFEKAADLVEFGVYEVEPSEAYAAGSVIKIRNSIAAMFRSMSKNLRTGA